MTQNKCCQYKNLPLHDKLCTKCNPEIEIAIKKCHNQPNQCEHEWNSENITIVCNKCGLYKDDDQSNQSWEERLYEQRWFCDDILRHKSWSYAPEIEQFIQEELDNQRREIREMVEKELHKWIIGGVGTTIKDILENI